MKRPQLILATCCAWLGLLCSSVAAFNITLQYQAGNLFSATHDATAKAAINAAAADLSAAITTNLSAINTDVYTGMSGGTSVTFDWSYQYTNPSTGSSTTINTPVVPSTTVPMFVGSRNLSGSTLGVGGPAGAGYELGASYSGVGPFNLAAAMASAEAQSESALKRSGGPILGSFSDTITLGPQSASFSIDFGIAYGSLAFDWNNSGDGGWHFNHTTSVASNKNDLYSVALHEMLHALGIGASDTWGAKNPDGTRNWNGSHVVALMGSGTNLLNPAADHITEGTMSTNAYTGAPQEAAMDPTVTQGSRKYLTALDLAFLRDLNYNTIDWVTGPSLPADFDNDGDVDGADLLIWRNNYDVDADGDADNDGDTDGRDFLVWQRSYTGAMLTEIVGVPEPTTGVLFFMSLALLVQRRRLR